MDTRLKDAFVKNEIQHIARENNEQANLLSKLGSMKKKGQHRMVIQETISEQSLDIMASVTLIDREWMIEIWNILEKGSLL